MIDYVIEKLDNDAEAPIDKYTTVFNRVKYDSLNNDPVILQLIQENVFQETLEQLTERQMFYTQSIGLELRKNIDSGFPWHVGTQSFAFQRAEDFACTIWTPLIEINKKTQRGGMSYIPKNLLSGYFAYQYINLVAPYLKDKSKNEDVTFNTFNDFKNSLMNTFPLKEILDYYSVEDDFNITDALIFDKYVIHKSNKLEEGKHDKRMAFVMRFIDINSEYDKNRAEIQEMPRKMFNYRGASCFHIDVCKEDKDKIAESGFFANKEQRIIGK